MLERIAFARRTAVAALVAFHILIIIASNYLVQLPLQLFGWHTTWGAFSFPFIFLATDLTVRLMGKAPARQVIARVMIPALVVSYGVSVLFQDGSFQGWAALAAVNIFVLRISLASFCAYVLGQLLDIQVFDRLRRWRPRSRPCSATPSTPWPSFPSPSGAATTPSWPVTGRRSPWSTTASS